MIAKHLSGMALIAAAAAVAAVVAASSASAAPAQHPVQRHGVTQTNLVSDQPGKAQITDPNLINAWGMSRSPGSPIWVSNAGTSTSTLYAGAVNGSPVFAAPAGAPLIVKVPGAPVTGQTFNSDSAGFQIPGINAPAVFMFATVGGTIAAWNPALGTQAATVATVPGASYTGLTQSPSPFGALLLAADFHDNRIDVFNSSFQKLDVPGLFQDRSVPRNYAPFNVQVLGTDVYVTYAKQDAAKQHDVAGSGLGFVDKFSTFGILEQRVATRGALNAPWGLVIAPASFGKFSNDLLVGNFGDGTIHAYNPRNGRFIATVTDTHGRAIRIDHLWGLLTGDAVAGGPNAIWFSAGPDNETHGLVGILTAS